MIGNFQACWDFTKTAEGGYTNNSQDPGNWTGAAVGVGELLGTNYGISAASYPNLDIANLTLATAGAIYQRDYWNKVAGDSLPVGVDLVTFDAAVNIGVGGSASILQGIVGALQDGNIGPKTLASVAAIHPADLVEAFTEARIAYYQGLATFAEFGTGWTSRTTACQTAALEMIDTAFKAGPEA